MTTAFVDFETRSRTDLKKCGMSRYARDPAANALCMAYSIDHGPVLLWTPNNPFPSEVLDAATLHAHNAAFEHTIFNNVLGIDIPPERFRCTAAKAAYAGIARSLEGAGETLGLSEEQAKLKEGKELVQQVCVKWNDDAVLREKLHNYCMQDVRAEQEVNSRLPEVPEFVYKNWAVDRIICRRGVPIDRQLCEGACEIMEKSGAEASSIAEALSGGEIDTGGQIKKILEFVNKRGVNIHDLQAETVQWAIEHTEDEDALAMLYLRQSVASAAAKKYPAALARMDDDDRLREGYMFYGTHTGRRTSPGVQLQNMKKGFKITAAIVDAIRSGDTDLLKMMYSSAPITMLGQAVRAMVCAPDGRKFAICDFSQIECRIAHWLAGSARMMSLFRQGGDPYIEFAAAFFKVTSVSKDQRQYSKPIVLGGNYGMGATRLMQYAEEYNVHLTEDQAEKTIEFFRAKNSHIVAYWKIIEKAAVQCVLNGKPVKVGPVCFRMEGEWLTLELPSTRKLYYHKPKLTANKWGHEFRYRAATGAYVKVWGGTWMENLCQAITADLTNLAQLHMEEAGIGSCIDQHDEIGVECDAGAGEKTVEQMIDIMRYQPEWARGLPIDADGRVRQRFEK